MNYQKYESNFQSCKPIIDRMEKTFAECDVILERLNRPYKSFFHWLVDGLTGHGWEAK